MPAIEVEELVIEYGKVRAVDGLSFQAQFGSILVLLGPNGAGKSSTVEAMEGFRSPSAGRISVDGLDPTREQRRLGSRLGVMLQGGGVNPRMTPKFALTLFAGYYPDPLDPHELLKTLDLETVALTPFRRLSGGEKQRLLLALAVIGRPKVAFLDEPTAGVDPAGRVLIRDMILKLKEKGVCIVLTTHELNEAERLADRLLIVARGREIATGTLEELKDAYSTVKISFTSPDKIDTLDFESTCGASLVARDHSHYEVDAEATPAITAAVAGFLSERGVRFNDFTSSGKSLEDIYLDLTTADANTSRRAASGDGSGS